TIDAIEDNMVYGVLPYNYYTANYGTILANSYYIGSILYPDRFDGVNLNKKADQIYKKLLGEGVYDDMEEAFVGYKNLQFEIDSAGDRRRLADTFYLPIAAAAILSIATITYFWKRKKR
ncbi:MAG: hypothetical protein V5A88_08720, partial [Candidatus Thermoplasmatota archaeon]